MMPRIGRSTLVEIAYRTLDAIKNKKYVAPSGAEVALDVSDCVNGTKFYSPRDSETLVVNASAAPTIVNADEIEVVNETSLQGAARLAGLGSFRDSCRYSRIGVLNFASARNPGGGFLDGAFSQEESLARSSALYPSLLTVPQYYDSHRSGSGVYSDAMIVTPDCPVFVDDAGNLLESPYNVTFITCAAPNAGRLNGQVRSTLPPIIQVRAAKVLGVALHHGVDALVLGAWGCGAFMNHPLVVASAFKTLLEGPFKDKFQKVLFSVYDPYPNLEVFSEFEDAFGKQG
jgi:uncharacterized protein (TIGR02452 family)